jgi:hypothetical protein
VKDDRQGHPYYIRPHFTLVKQLREPHRGIVGMTLAVILETLSLAIYTGRC